jgi:nucleoside-diphosphate-sugar epimerase
MKGKRIALIGGAGFIGHNLALELARRGAEVAIVDSLQVNNLLAFASADLNLPNRRLYRAIINERLDLIGNSPVQLFVQDCQDYHALGKILEKFKAQVIVHLAAVAHAGKSNKDPYSTFGHSLRTLENALDQARSPHVEHFVFFSSSMVYGNFLTPEVAEDHPLNPIGIYGALKLAGEKFVIAYNQVFGLPYTIIRPSALYGPRCVSRRVIQIFIENAMEGLPLKMEGGGTESLDFTYIDDLVEGICLTIEKPAARNQVVNLTNGSARSLADVVAAIRKEFPSVKVENVARDNLMPVRGTLSIEKARKLLGFEPQNPIDVGIPKYIAWYRQHQFHIGKK